MIDKKFARALAKQLFSICTQHDNDIFFIMDSPVRTALRALIEEHPKEIWTEASKLLLQNDPEVKFRFEHLVECPAENHLGSGLFYYNLPAELYLDWARKAPSLRAFIIVKWMPLTLKTTGDELSWHPALQTFIAEFGAADHVLDELSARLCPRSWSGSLVPYLEPLLSLLETWTSHPLPTVRQWASRQIIGLKNWIEQERRGDEENIIRYR